ncbi:MAG: M48 family metallopeptidase [Gammaproteobacteria bacterium]|nr:M48 family metallopeptidase [Gammaproteobacteria bacterium]
MIYFYKLIKTAAKCQILVLSIMLYLYFLQTAQATGLPDMGASADTVLSLAEEQKLGEAFIRKLRKTGSVLDDQAVNEYLNALGYNLASHSENPQQAFTFFVLNDPAINAFAVPGGFIGINSGLFLHTQSESELASVLAHEIAHVTQRHIARTIEAAGKFSLPAMAVMIAAIVAGVNNPDIAQAAITSVAAASVQMQLDFTRAHEKEADRTGIETLAGAGYDPRGMPAFFKRMQTASRYYEGGMPEFLRTHPVTTDRIAEALARAEQFPGKTAVDDPLYHLIRARILAATSREPEKLAEKLKNALAVGKYRDERAVRYGVALALMKSNNSRGVQAQLDWLLKHDGDRVIYRSAAARLADIRNKPAEAMHICEQALKVYPGDVALSLAYAKGLLQNAKPAKAKTILLSLPARTHPDHYRMLAEAQKRSGEPGEAYLSLAEYFYVNGQTGLAIEQLKQAQQLKNLDFYLASKVEARLKQLRYEANEEQAGKRQFYEPNG